MPNKSKENDEKSFYGNILKKLTFGYANVKNFYFHHWRSENSISNRISIASTIGMKYIIFYGKILTVSTYQGTNRIPSVNGYNSYSATWWVCSSFSSGIYRTRSLIQQLPSADLWRIQTRKKLSHQCIARLSSCSNEGCSLYRLYH